MVWSDNFTHRLFLILLFVFYIAGVFVLFYYVQAPVVFLALILILNFGALFLSGNYLLRAILFPYANRQIKNQLDSGINRRSSTEFTRLVVLASHIVKVLAGLEPLESYFKLKDDLNTS